MEGEADALDHADSRLWFIYCQFIFLSSVSFRNLSKQGKKNCGEVYLWDKKKKTAVTSGNHRVSIIHQPEAVSCMHTASHHLDDWWPLGMKKRYIYIKIYSYHNIYLKQILRISICTVMHVPVQWKITRSCIRHSHTITTVQMTCQTQCSEKTPQTRY